MIPLVEIKQLSFKYPDYPELKFNELFTNINLTLHEGDFRVILGKPESGKTTLSRILTGLIPRYTGGSLTGTVSIRGKNIDSFKPYDLIEQVGCVFQNPDEQIITTRCDSEIAFPMESLGWDRSTIETKLDQAFHATGMSDFRKRNPATLSGGEKKKLLITALFGVNPEVWILDETVEELDPASLNIILEKIIKMEKTILLFASKVPSVLKDLKIQYSLITQGELLHKEDLPETEYQNLLKKEGLVIPHYTEQLYSLPGPQKNLPLTQELLHAVNIRYKYKNNDAFSLSIDAFSLKEGEIVSIVGKNGSGKSTLGKIFSGLIKPDSGALQILNNGEKETASEKYLNRFCGFLFQNPDSQIFLPSVREELSFNVHLSEEELANTIKLFSLPNGEVPPALMSYGARKRLQGAVYSLLRKKLYIIDEADSALSVADFSNIVHLLKKERITIIIITHNMELSRLFSNRIFIMEKGKILTVIKRRNFLEVQKYFNSVDT